MVISHCTYFKLTVGMLCIFQRFNNQLSLNTVQYSPPHMEIGGELKNTFLKISRRALSSPRGVQSMLKVFFLAYLDLKF